MKNDLKILENIRKDLQELDLQILLLMLERYKLAEGMGNIKKQHNLEIFQESEWQRKINFLSAHLEGHPRTEEVLQVFHFIHNQSIEIQKSIQDD